MKLGEMLVRDGRLSEAQLTLALAHQGRDGGRIGTVIVELGLLDLDALTVYLGLELGIPIATGAMFERAKRSAVRLLTPAQAFRHKCVPLIVQDRQLIAAVEDPHDFDNLDALSEITGYRVIPRVAPEIRVYYYVERYFGVPRPPRFMKFGDTPRGDQAPADQGLPAPPLPGLPPVASRPMIAPGPGPRLRRTAVSAGFDDSEALELDAEDLMVTLESDEQAAAEQAPPSETPGRITRPVQAVTPEPYQPIELAAAKKAIAAAEDRADIADAMMRFASGLFDIAVLFIVKDNLALGWKSAGGGATRAYADHLLVPLEAPSLIRSAVQSEDGVVDGPIAPSTVHTYLYKVLGCFEPPRATAAVVSIGRRVVNILYGHRDQRAPLDATEVDQVRQLCRSGAEAYARLIAVSKRRAETGRDS
jgi:hypothetical protein